ncbi:MAG: hypothetical protein CL677_02735 [Bdellovibrionaceae bacterium]|nr:hypothetical protein [Pseudobdellovibrionaceae bacterium]|tara:strand:+ start:301 stop:732 length:432 start_codon:yes stop_codon:yes gene_type:complete
MSDRRMTERRDDLRGEETRGERRDGNQERRMIQRFTNKSVRESVEQLSFWLRVLCGVLTLFGIYQLVQVGLVGVRQSGPEILNAVLLFCSAYFTYSPIPWSKTYLLNESVSNFENLFDRLTGLVRFSSFLAALYLIVFVVKQI